MYLDGCPDNYFAKPISGMLNEPHAASQKIPSYEARDVKLIIFSMQREPPSVQPLCLPCFRGSQLARWCEEIQGAAAARRIVSPQTHPSQVPQVQHSRLAAAGRKRCAGYAHV